MDSHYLPGMLRCSNDPPVALHPVEVISAAWQDGPCLASLGRRTFLKLAGGSTAALLASRMSLSAAPVSPADAELTAAYAKYLRETKGIVDIRTIHSSGEGPNWVHVVIVSAGFTEDQMADFHSVCQRVTKAMLSVEPWTRYKSLINVHAVFVGDTSQDLSRLNVSGYKGNILGCDNGIAVEYSRYAANSAATLVIHNSVFSTAGAGVWGVATINKGNPDDPMAAVHEIGHGMAGLGDEYIQRQDPFKDAPETLDDTINVTATANPKLCKWHYWTEEEWPGLFSTLKRRKGANVANCEGAGWPKGIYRPEESCMMRCSVRHFCVVCNETMETSFFRYIDLFQAVEPRLDDLLLWKGESIDFRVRAIDMVCQAPEWLKSRLNFYLDGRQVASSERGEVTLQLRSATAGPGIHQLGANLNIQSENIRRDFGFLSSSLGWRVKVLPYQKPVLIMKPRVEVAPDGTLDGPVVLRHENPGLFQLKMTNAPKGAVFEGGRFKWKPGGLTGSWRVDIAVSLDQQVVMKASMVIHAKSPKAGEDILEVPAQEPVDAVTGTGVVFQLKATAKDNGCLLFETVSVPEGVALICDTGHVSWTPTMTQAGPRRLRFRVHNGPVSREFWMVVRVRRAAMPAPVSYCNSYIPQSLEALKRLKTSPLVYRRMFETLRLLRDRYARIYLPALADAKTMYDELSSELRSNCMQELHLHAWEFANKPEILKWMRAAAAAGRPEHAAVLKKRLDQIDSYNAARTAPASK